jgi:hypothetical protein
MNDKERNMYITACFDNHRILARLAIKLQDIVLGFKRPSRLQMSLNI